MGMPHLEQTPGAGKISFEPWVKVLQTSNGIGGKSPPFTLTPQVFQILTGQLVKLPTLSRKNQILTLKEDEEFVNGSIVSLFGGRLDC